MVEGGGVAQSQTALIRQGSCSNANNNYARIAKWLLTTFELSIKKSGEDSTTKTRTHKCRKKAGAFFKFWVFVSSCVCVEFSFVYASSNILVDCRGLFLSLPFTFRAGSHLHTNTDRPLLRHHQPSKSTSRAGSPGKISSAVLKHYRGQQDRFQTRWFTHRQKVFTRDDGRRSGDV